MDRVCCIIDMDGFHISLDGLSKHKFYVREFGYVRVSKEYTLMAHSHRFDLRGKLGLDKLDPKLERKLRYQIKLTGLSVFPLDNEPVMNYDDLNDLMIATYERCRTPDMYRVAYKGGIIEKTFLADLKIPSLNLESYGCPRYDELIKSPAYRSTSNCGFHREATTSTPHCPLAEVTAFRTWLQMHCRYRKPGEEVSESDEDSQSSCEDSDSDDN